METKKSGIYIALALFAFALALRLIGIGWGLKNDLHDQSYHPDEAVIFLNSQRIEPTRLQFTPDFYNYPTLYLTVLRVAGDMTAAYTGGYDERSEESFWGFASRVHFAGRIISAVAGSAMALMMFFIASRLFGSWAGIAAGLAVAVAPGHVMHSRFQTVDIFAAMLMTASTLYALKLLTPRRQDQGQESLQTTFSDREVLRLALLSGVFAGLAAGTKYTSILVILTLYVVLYMTKPAGWAKAAAGATGIAIGAFLISTPGVLLETQSFIRDFTYEMHHTATGHGLVFEGTSPAFVYHLGNLGVGLGILLTLMGLVGLVYAVYRRHVWAIALLACFLPYYLVIGRAEVKFLRYTFPLYIALATGFGYTLAAAQRRERFGRLGVAVGILAIGGVDGGGLTGSSRVSAWMAATDPRDQAAMWLRQRAQENPNITVGYAKDPWFWSVPLFRQSTAGPLLPLPQRLELMAEMTQPTVLYFYDPEGHRNFDPRLLTQLRPDYVTMTSFEFGDLERLRRMRGITGDAKILTDEYIQFREVLDRDYKPVLLRGVPVAPIHDFKYPQPQVIVWERADRTTLP
jgi:hypothetical protein